MNKIKCEISEKAQKIACENFNKALASWKEEWPEEVEGIADNEFNSENLSLISINNRKGLIYDTEAKYSKTFSNGKKIIYILKFCDDFDVFDDVLYTENKGE